ncbi:hypothetical protein K435DRAFT_861168 [Dendrothele bispora CBS 962.96]|uniref:Uncharacterized protein n=1 Tax=Dendrothele bispora (strain CBS 962.96) TaxID=1314807 RepID=A0A4S8LWD1_DENBC|nr:hypothetical protein K435DRAFT_861168 [Dendrothele bispora CBS 962.96]
MSLEAGDDAVSLNDQRIENYLHLIGFAVLLWDFVLTFCGYGSRIPMEASEQFIDQTILLQSLPFFDRNISRNSLSFFTLSFPFASLGVIQSCGALHIFREVLLVVIEVVVSIYLTFRIYVVYSQNKKVFIFMISVGSVLAGLALFALFFGPSSKSAVSLTPFGCHTNLDFLPHLCTDTLVFLTPFTIAVALGTEEAASWEALFVYDVLLFIMLVRRGYKVYRSSQRIPILDIILRDGASYFVVMALANLANIFTFYVCLTLL